MKIVQSVKFAMRISSPDPVEIPDRVEQPSDELAATIRSQIPDDGQEHLWVVAVDAHFQPIACSIVATGSVDQCPLFPRDVYAWALTVPGCRFVGIAHNHPSGDTTPSTPDIMSSSLVAKAGQMLPLDLLWSVVVTHINKTWQIVPLAKGRAPQPQEEPYRPKDPDEEQPQPDGGEETGPDGDEEQEQGNPEPGEDEQPDEETRTEPDQDAKAAQTTAGTTHEVTVDELKASVRRAFKIG